VSDRSEDNAGLLEYLAGLIEHIGGVTVVSCREGGGDRSGPASHDVPIVEVVSDESDDQICIVRKGPGENPRVPLSLESFYRQMQAQIARHPFSRLVVSEWFQIDDEHRGRIDMALSGIELDEDSEVVRLIF
jgi:hypothetical protein